MPTEISTIRGVFHTMVFSSEPVAPDNLSKLVAAATIVNNPGIVPNPASEKMRAA
jgi:hypothetical protein